MLEHGGDLRNAAQQYGTPSKGWLDLSTGINPHAWQGEVAPPLTWRRLPQRHDGLIAAACDYYGATRLLPVPGTQAAIQILPRLRAQCRVAVVEPGYAEHAHRWRAAGHAVSSISNDSVHAAANEFDVLVLCNPNNPTGARYAPSLLMELHARLAYRGGWLIVDEAFIDATPAESLAEETGREGLIVLRSFGKFFGLAGVRLGFVLAWSGLLQLLEEWIGPWAVNGPARHLACLALRDVRWQVQTRRDLHEASARLAASLQPYDLAPNGGCAFFQWIETPQAEAIHQAFAQRGVLVRCFASPASLRFGLPGDALEWMRLHRALAGLRIAGRAA